MAYVDDSIFDAALNIIVGTRTLTPCSAEPANYAGIAAVALGNASVVISAPVDGVSPVQRRIIVPAVTNGVVTAAGTATHYAVHNNVDTMYIVQPTGAAQPIVLGAPFTTPEFDFFFNEPT